MRRTIVNWKQLQEILENTNMCNQIIGIAYNNDKLESITFASWDDADHENTEVKNGD